MASATVVDSTKAEPTVFLIDSDALVCEAVCRLVRTMRLRCEVYSSAEHFLKASVDTRPGCVVLEARIPGISGLQLQRELRSRRVTLPVIFLAADPDVVLAVTAMREGAMHFLEKPFREFELWDTIQEAIALDRERRCGEIESRRVRDAVGQLDASEREVLDLIVEGKSKKTIASELDVCVRTVEIRRRKLMAKLQVESLVGLIEVAIIARNGSSTDGLWSTAPRQIKPATSRVSLA